MADNNKKAEGGLKQIMNVRLEKMDALRERGVDPFGHRFDITHHINEIIDQKDALVESGKEVKIAGRIMAKRGQGKAGKSTPAKTWLAKICTGSLKRPILAISLVLPVKFLSLSVASFPLR